MDDNLNQLPGFSLRGFSLPERSVWSRYWHFKQADTKVLVTLAGAYALFLAPAVLAWGMEAWPVALVLLLVAVVIVQLNMNRLQQKRAEQQLRSIQAVESLHRLLPVRGALPPLTGWAASPELALTLTELIRLRRPRRIVELGSGSSTVVMAYALERNGHGVVHSMDHDGDFAQVTRRMIANHRLEEYAQVHHAPLVPYKGEEHDGPWYDGSVMRDVLTKGEPVDLVVVDGPPRGIHVQARFPALPALAEYLSDDAVVVVDDAARSSERQAIERWLERYPGWCVEWHRSPKSTALLYREN